MFIITAAKSFSMTVLACSHSQHLCCSKATSVAAGNIHASSLLPQLRLGCPDASDGTVAAAAQQRVAATAAAAAFK